MNNVIFYRLPEFFRERLSDLDETLRSYRLKPLGPGELITGGFVSPYDDAAQEGPVALEEASFLMLRWMTEERVLPGEVVQQAVTRKARAIEQESGQPLSSKQLKQLKEEVVEKLTARALTRFAKTDVILDKARMLFIVGASGYKRAEMIIEALRGAFGSFPVRTLEPAEKDLVDIMTAWLEAGEAGAPFDLGEACELHNSDDDGGAIVKYRRQDLCSEEITEHLKVGKQCVCLDLSLPGRLSFSITSDYLVRGIKYPKELFPSDSQGQGDALLFGSELGNLFDHLEKACDIAPIDGPLFALPAQPAAQSAPPAPPRPSAPPPPPPFAQAAQAARAARAAQAVRAARPAQLLLEHFDPEPAPVGPVPTPSDPRQQDELRPQPDHPRRPLSHVLRQPKNTLSLQLPRRQQRARVLPEN